MVTILKDYVDSSGNDDDESDSSRRNSIIRSELGWSFSFSSVDYHLQNAVNDYNFEERYRRQS